MAAVGVLIVFRVPASGYHAVPGRAMQFLGMDEPSQIHAVAVTGPDTTWGTVWALQRGMLREDDEALARHIEDEAAARSRAEAWAAAHVAVGVPVTRWMISSQSTTGAGQVMEQVDCHRDQCSAVLVNGNIPGVGMQAGQQVTFALPPSDVLQPVLPDTYGPAPVSYTLAGWTGSSAGLAYALAYVEEITGEPVVPAGLQVAATGTIAVTPNGRVLVEPVDQVPEKVHSAALDGADVLLVPVGEAVPGGEVPTVEVESLFGALEWLCQQGSAHSRCTLDGQWDPRADT